MRINKFLADAGVCSRRAADALVANGSVMVNGAVITSLGTQVDEVHDQIVVNGKPIRLSSVAPICIMLNKPVGVVSTVSDPQGRKTVLDCIPPSLKAGRRLYPAGRLDFFSEGLLLITDDGTLTEHLVHPRHHLPKTYRVTVRGNVTERTLFTMRSGMTLTEGEQLAPVEARVVRREGDAFLLELILHQGVNRQIRRMCRDLDLTILRLIRINQGPLALGRLPSGSARLLSKEELSSVKRATGMI